MVIKEIRLMCKMSQKEFSKYFGIPFRTVQEWEQDRRKPPDYIPKLLKRIWELECRQCVHCSSEMICKNGCSSSGNCTYPKCSYYEK